MSISLREIYKSGRADSHNEKDRKKDRERQQLIGRAQTWRDKLVSKARNAGDSLHRTNSEPIGQVAAKRGSVVETHEAKDHDESDYKYWARENKFSEPIGEPFEYTDALRPNGVDGQCLRILEMLPGHPRDPIHCKLKTVTLKEAPPYHALSYAWGNDEHVVGVYIDGDKVLKVSSNLRSAFRHLRSREESTFLWVDAVCINQHDTNEKSWQVSMMSQFYRKSSKTIIWIGPEYDDSWKALHICRILARAEEAERTEKVSNPLEDISWDPADKEQAQGTLQPTKSSIWNGAVDTFLWQPWFERSWVVQEALLSEEAAIHCGFDCVEWADAIRGVVYGYDKDLLSGELHGVLNVVGGMDSKPVANESQGPADTLLELLIRFRRKQATLPVDKVYCFLGLVEDIGKLNIAPDYTLSFDEVYRITTVAILKNTNHLDILGAVDATSVSPLPLSWVADWRIDAAVVYPFHTHTDRHEATRGSVSVVRFEDAERTLVLSGHSIGKIEAIARVMPLCSPSEAKKLHEFETTFSNELLNPDVDWDALDVSGTAKVVQRMAKIAKQSVSGWTQITAGYFFDTANCLLEWEHFAGVERKESISSRAYRETLNAGQLLEGDESVTQAEYFKWYDALANLRKIQKLSFAAKSKTLVVVAYFRSKVHGMPFPDSDIYCGRRLAYVDGRLALVPPTAMLGDEVFLLKGGSVPLVARKSGKNWRMMGESYVNGVMKGDFFKEKECQDLRFE